MQHDIKLKAIIDAIPSAIFIVNQELQIIDINQAASKMVGADSEIILRKLCVDVYFRKMADIKFSHGICPDCSDKLYSEMKSRI